MKTKLSTRAVTELYFYLLQAERSAHKVLGNHWSDLKLFYDAERIANVREVVKATQGALGSAATAPPPRWEEIHRRSSTLGPFRYFFGRWLARWRKVWSFPGGEVRRMVESLEAALRLFATDAKPPADELVALRLELCHCRSLIEVRCYGLPVLDFAVRIEHLYVSEWLSPVSLADMLASETTNRRGARKGFPFGRGPAHPAREGQSHRA
jgi:hypothetical protein